MRQVLHALIVATVAAAVLIGGAHAETLGSTASSTRSVELYATVVKPFGAAIRMAPSSEAATLLSAACGEIWPVVEVQGGWVKVRLDDGAGDGWIGGARVSVNSSPRTANCAGSRMLYPGADVYTSVTSGCLSLRTSPSRDASQLACVPNGHDYTVEDGPFDPGTGEDWFNVYSPSTGQGWALAEYLYPEER